MGAHKVPAQAPRDVSLIDGTDTSSAGVTGGDNTFKNSGSFDMETERQREEEVVITSHSLPEVKMVILTADAKTDGHWRVYDRVDPDSACKSRKFTVKNHRSSDASCSDASVVSF